jgi:cell division protein FtsB
MRSGADSRRAPPAAASIGRDVFWIALAAAVAGFVLLEFRPNRDRIREARAERRLLEREIASLEGRIARLRLWERRLAEGDREAWAAVAREKLGWLAPGERLLRAGSRPRGRRDLSRAAFVLGRRAP